jgi:hypothetical protein
MDVGHVGQRLSSIDSISRLALERTGGLWFSGITEDIDKGKLT